MCVMFVVKHSVLYTLLKYTSLYTQGKNPTPVISVGRPSHSVLLLLSTDGVTQVRNHMSAKFVTRHLFPEPSLTHISGVMVNKHITSTVFQL